MILKNNCKIILKNNCKIVGTHFDTYAHDSTHRLTVRVAKNNNQFSATVSVCVPPEPGRVHWRYKLPENKVYVLIKTWTENEGIEQLLIDTGEFIDTGIRVPTGFVTASVFEFTGDISRSFHRDARGD